MTFTAAIFRALKRDPEMAETVEVWEATPGTVDERVIAFGDELRKDIEMVMRSAAVSLTPNETTTHLLLDVVDQVMSHTAWSRIARQLLKDFGAEAPAGYRTAPSLVPSIN